MQQIGDSPQIVIGMVGLPARGKTHYARKLMRYVSWLGYSSKVFNLANYRRQSFGTSINPQFFDSANEEAKKTIITCTNQALQDMSTWIEKGGQIAIYDATNTTIQKRQSVVDLVKSLKRDIIFFWIECIVDDEKLIDELIKVQHNNPDYANSDLVDLKTQIFQIQRQFSEDYDPLSKEESVSFLKIYNLGSNYVVNGITGYLPCKILCFLMNLNVLRKTIYLSRHGESQANVEDRVGGDSELSAKGQQYADMLEGFFKNELEKPVRVFTSTLRRAISTAEKTGMPVFQVKNLDEINVGVCDGMTYKEIEERYPFENQERNANKLSYRYPRGESYLDLISRLEPIIFEMERVHEPIVIVAHQAILRCIYAYLKSIPIIEVPYISIPQHSVMKLIPEAYVCKEDRFNFILNEKKIIKVEVSNDDIVYVTKFSDL